MPLDLEKLHAPFPPNEIEWRVGSTNKDKTSGLALAYLTSRHVMNRLDEVCGIDGWQDRYEFHGARTVCYLSLKIGDEWITKADGAGDSDVEAEKGAISDALKRAAVKWGIGRYLYSLGSTWVDIEPAGRSVRIKRSEYPRLEKMLKAKFGGKPSADAPDQYQDAPEPGEPTVQDHIEAIETADTLPTLQAVFGAAWKAIIDEDERAKLKQAYEKRKSQVAAKSHLDNLAQSDAA